MDQVEEVKSKIDLVELVSSYIPVKKSGRNFAALCPFHAEKTPSFMISAERGVWKCFGCGEGGDAFTFLEKIEGWEFKEALEELAKRVGVKLKSYEPTARVQTRDKLIEINNLCAKFYNFLLISHPTGKRARNYLEKRGIKKEIWEKFSLGYAPPGWENLLKFLIKHKYALSDIATAGLVVAGRGNRSYWDRFRDRLMFALKDSRGSVLGFSGRVIEAETQSTKFKTQNEPKYINSPETPVFNKGSLLFGFDVTRGAVRDKNEAILVEGEFDVLSSYQSGVENVVATKGTALTEKQVALVARSSESVVLCFDTDVAGDSAARRGIELLDLAGVNIRVATFGKYKDPDEFSQNDPDGFKKALAEASNVYDYFLESAKRRFDAGSVEGKKKIGREILPILAKISDEIVRAHYIEKLAKILDLEVSLVANAVSKKTGEIAISSEKGDDLGGTKLEDYFLALFLAPDEVSDPKTWKVKEGDFEGEQASKLWSVLSDIMGTSRKRIKSRRDLLLQIPKDLGSYVDTLFLVEVSPNFDDRAEWAVETGKVAARIRLASLKRKLRAVSSKIKEAQERSRGDEVAKLSRKFSRIAKDLEEVKLTLVE